MIATVMSLSIGADSRWSFTDAEALTDGKGGGAPFMGTVNKGQGGVGGFCRSGYRSQHAVNIY